MNPDWDDETEDPTLPPWSGWILVAAVFILAAIFAAWRYLG